MSLRDAHPPQDHYGPPDYQATGQALVTWLQPDPATGLGRTALAYFPYFGEPVIYGLVGRGLGPESDAVPSWEVNGRWSVLWRDSGASTPGLFERSCFAPGTAPTVTQHPAEAAVAEGQDVTFTAAASGAFPLNAQFQEFRDGAWLDLGTPSILTTSGTVTATVRALTVADNGRQYRFVFTNGGGSATTLGATVTVWTTTVVAPPPSTVSASRGYLDIFYVVVDSVGNVSTWGMNPFGGLGYDTGGAFTTVPLRLGGMPPIQQVQAGGDHVLALDVLGNVWAWGRNHLGQVGNGSGSAVVPTPVQLTGLTNIARIGAGVDHSLAVDVDGNVYAWGNNAQGQLGLGTSGGIRITPIRVALPVGAPVIDVAGGLGHSLTLRADGTVLAWGDNAEGQLGDGTTTPSPTPVLVSGLTNVKAIAAGRRHSMAAVPLDATYYLLNLWGANNYGQLGTGDTVSRSLPTPLYRRASLTFGGDETVLAVIDGHFEGWENYGWGLNDCGQLGDSTQGVCLTSNVVPPALTPRQLDYAFSIQATSVSSGMRHSIAARSWDGTVWVWGLSVDGVTPLNRPVVVSGFTLN